MIKWSEMVLVGLLIAAGGLAILGMGGCAADRPRRRLEIYGPQGTKVMRFKAVKDTGEECECVDLGGRGACACPEPGR